MQNDPTDPKIDQAAAAGNPFAHVTDRPSIRDDDTPSANLAQSASDQPGGSPFVAFYRPARLGIIHLLAWTAVTAVLLSLTMSLRSLAGQPTGTRVVNSWSEGFVTVYWMVETIVMGAGLVGLFVLARDRFRGATGHLQPGHWLVLAQSAPDAIRRFVYVTAMLMLLLGNTGMGSSPMMWIARIPPFVSPLLACGFYWAGTVRCPAGRLWRWTLGMLAVNSGMSVCLAASILALRGSWIRGFATIITTLGWVTGLIYLAGAFLLLVGAIRDLRRRNRRDWLHWLGVAMIASTVLFSLVTLAWHFATRF